MKTAASTRSSADSTRPTRDPSRTGPGSRPTFGISRFIEFARNLDLLGAVNVLTLVLVVIFQLDHWLFHIVAGICFLIFALYPPSLRRPQFWFALGLAGTIAIILTWENVDNHKYLLVYWTWVLFVVHLFREP
jgi:hypothetical protein